MKKKIFSFVVVVVLFATLLVALMGVPAFATDPSPATLVGVPSVRKLELGGTSHLGSYRSEFDYPNEYAEHAQVEIYASVALSDTTATGAVTMTVQSSALGANWVSHSDTATFVGSSPANTYTIVPHRGAKMALYWTVPSTQTITPTVELVFSNRK